MMVGRGSLTTAQFRSARVAFVSATFWAAKPPSRGLRCTIQDPSR